MLVMAMLMVLVTVPVMMVIIVVVVMIASFENNRVRKYIGSQILKLSSIEIAMFLCTFNFPFVYYSTLVKLV
jgi:hypothetical protein